MFPPLPGTVLMSLRRVGPYHRARIQAASRSGLKLWILETRPDSQEYPWGGEFTLDTGKSSLLGAITSETDPPFRSLCQQLNVVLDQVAPSVIVSVGWADRSYQQLLVHAHQRRIPLVLVSDSRFRDEPRSAMKEWLKSQLLRGYSSTLSAGTESRAYLEFLRIPASKFFQPWDVVDNNLFAQEADKVERHRPPHFLCVSRLIEKKNHRGLLQAYANYQRQSGRWGLVLVGSGPCEDSIRAQIAALPDPSQVKLLPFCQLEELGRLYGAASAFVLASSSDQWGLVVNEAMAAGLPCLVSTACGCAVDLIEHGITGWSFDPANLDALTFLMHRAEHQSASDRAAMMAAARERLTAYSPESFAHGLRDAVAYALAHPRFSRRACLTAQILALR